MTAHWSTLRVATYNIHRCRGLDGRTNPKRIAEVIRAIGPDVAQDSGKSAAAPGHGPKIVRLHQ